MIIQVNGSYSISNLLIFLFETSASLYSKCTVFVVNICYLQVLAMYKKVLS